MAQRQKPKIVKTVLIFPSSFSGHMQTQWAETTLLPPYDATIKKNNISRLAGRGAPHFKTQPAAPMCEPMDISPCRHKKVKGSPNKPPPLFHDRMAVNFGSIHFTKRYWDPTAAAAPHRKYLTPLISRVVVRRRPFWL